MDDDCLRLQDVALPIPAAAAAASDGQAARRVLPLIIFISFRTIASIATFYRTPSLLMADFPTQPFEGGGDGGRGLCLSLPSENTPLALPHNGYSAATKWCTTLFLNHTSYSTQTHARTHKHTKKRDAVKTGRENMV